MFLVYTLNRVLKQCIIWDEKIPAHLSGLKKCTISNSGPPLNANPCLHSHGLLQYTRDISVPLIYCEDFHRHGVEFINFFVASKQSHPFSRKRENINHKSEKRETVNILYCLRSPSYCYNWKDRMGTRLFTLKIILLLFIIFFGTCQSQPCFLLYAASSVLYVYIDFQLSIY